MNLRFFSNFVSEREIRSMSQKPVITVEEITQIALQERRPGCEKGVLHEDTPVQTAVYRVQPGSGVPTHLHARVHDLFIGMKGQLEIRYEGEDGSGVFVLKPGGFCRMPPGGGTNYRIRARRRKRSSCSCKRRSSVSIMSRRPFARLRQRCRSHPGAEQGLCWWRAGHE